MALRELARIIDVSPAYPGLIERGERPEIGSGVAAGIARTFGATIDYLVVGAGEPPTPDQAAAAVASAREAYAAAHPSEPTSDTAAE